MNYESLHNHTTLSDGAQSPRQVLKTAGQHGFGVVALTDHDALPDSKILADLKNYRGPVKWLIGIELSSGLPRELGGGSASMFHVLGLFTDPASPALLEHCRRAREARLERMERLVVNLRQLGLTISADDCLAESGGESVGRPHVVAALLKHPENLPVIERLRRRMEQAAAHDAKLANEYREMMRRYEGQGAAALPYGLFLSDRAFVPDVYVDYAYWADMDQSVALIRGAGGIALIAHWPTIMEKVDAAMLERFLLEKRLDGVELATGFVGPATQEQTGLLRQMADRTGAATSLGVDGHEAADFERFIRQTGMAAETAGQTARLIRRYRPDLDFSNFNA